SSLMRVLVVDDHELTRFYLKVALQSYPDIQLVGLATNGQEAVDIAAASHPDVIILDLNMPVLDGVSASKQIKSIAPDIKIIGYSSIQAPYVQSLLEAAQLDAFCDKSTLTQDLIHLARELVQ
ncbi:MAG TPA: response regulator transcription factor, partial [Candidatus Caenarcaniphilales bacterium]